ncbi:MAG: hypothetical protein HQK49_17240 [Oligoflexia bacterium]|nr:hypothetical protein [Oligoflexia bacterium]
MDPAKKKIFCGKIMGSISLARRLARNQKKAKKRPSEEGLNIQNYLVAEDGFEPSTFGL